MTKTAKDRPAARSAPQAARIRDTDAHPRRQLPPEGGTGQGRAGQGRGCAAAERCACPRTGRAAGRRERGAGSPQRRWAAPGSRAPQRGCAAAAEGGAGARSRRDKGPRGTPPAARGPEPSVGYPRRGGLAAAPQAASGLPSRGGGGPGRRG